MWNEHLKNYKSPKSFKHSTICYETKKWYLRELFDSSFQGIKILFALAYYGTDVNVGVIINTYQKYFNTY